MRYLAVLLAFVAFNAFAAEGRYLIVADGQHGGVWKLDTLTGTLWRCTANELKCFVVQ